MQPIANTSRIRLLKATSLILLLLALVACGAPTAPPEVPLDVDSTLSVPFDQQRTLEFTRGSAGGFDSDMDVTLSAPAGFEISPLSFQLTAAAPTVSVTIKEVSSSAGEHELGVSATGSGCNCTPADRVVTLTSGAIVTSLADNLVDPAPGELRYYLALARAEHVTFDPELFDGGSAEIALAGTIALNRDFTITGPTSTGAPLLSLVGDKTFTIVSVSDTAAVALANLQIRDGQANLGGGLHTGPDTELQLSAVRFESNHADSHGGAIYNLGTMEIADSYLTVNMADLRGGGIWNSGSLSVVDSIIESNLSGQYGGGINSEGATSTVVLTDTILSMNGTDARGGGIYLAEGALTITRGTIILNEALQNGGGIFTHPVNFSTGSKPVLEIEDSDISDNLATDGGGIFSYGDSTITNSRIERNVATNNGGGVRNHWKMTIAGGSLINDNEAGNEYGGLYNDGYLEVSDSYLENNEAGTNGGGFYNGWHSSDRLSDGTKKMAALQRTVVKGNSAGGDGGGIYSIRYLTVTDSQISENDSGANGGGIFSLSYVNSGAPDNDGGSVEISGSTISDNTATEAGGGLYSFTIYSDFYEDPLSPITIVNSTIANNDADLGGGLYLHGNNDADAKLFFNTIAGNTAAGTLGEGGGIHINREFVSLKANLIVNNSATANSDYNDIISGGGQVTSLGHNFIETAPLFVTPLATDEMGTSAATVGAVQLGPIADNGGPTTTMALAATSSAADSVPGASCLGPDGSALTTDQRGEPRPVAGMCSVGAYQVQ